MDAGKGKFYFKCLGMQQSELCLLPVGSPYPRLPLSPPAPLQATPWLAHEIGHILQLKAESSANVLTAFRLRLWRTLDTLLSLCLCLCTYSPTAPAV